MKPRYWRWKDEPLPFTRAIGSKVEYLDGGKWLPSCHTVEAIEAYANSVECTAKGGDVTTRDEWAAVHGTIRAHLELLKQ